MRTLKENNPLDMGLDRLLKDKEEIEKEYKINSFLELVAEILLQNDEFEEKKAS